MKLKLLLPIALLFSVLAASCEGGVASDENINKSELTDELAIYYYKLKFNGNYQEHIANMNSCDSTTEKYKKRMHDLLTHHVKDIHKEKKGIDSIRVTRKQFNANEDVAYIYLNVAYKNKTTEEVLLPLVLIDKEWHIR